MLVRNRMTINPMTITPETSFTEAYQLINENKFRHLPVVNKKGELVGIVAQADLLHASPSSATTLSVFEINYLLAKLQIEEVMSSPPITVHEDTPLEEAARLMIEKRIGCLLVTRGTDLVGVITETDIFKTFVEILGGAGASLRVTVQVKDKRGELARLSGVISGLGGNICSVARFGGDDPEYCFLTFRLEGVEEKELLPALEAAGATIVHTCCAA